MRYIMQQHAKRHKQLKTLRMAWYGREVPNSAIRSHCTDLNRCQKLERDHVCVGADGM